ncbi:DUF3426 domain-containing protein [Lysobacter pythonis]|uniref:DUF3426 domain-containing protein n=1 Tax=Solilutibacter pythonis TaxID=2483112 RepID=A0A3M2HX80_9GAMM|nr:DUF3426 domain-containing protein [Lysobacter pythonis]RMH92875.1 DUF3426 domain-containing protein [Lysobacter pythonis]
MSEPRATATDTDTPSFAAGTASARPTASPALWLACGILLTSLLGMLLVAGRGQLAADARTRPLAERACALLGCRLPVWRDAGAFRMLAHDVRADPQQPGVLRVRAGFRNEAPWPQAWPRLVLTLSDANGQPLARRAFTPDEYLADAPPPLIGAGQTASLQLAVHEPARPAVAFQFGFDPD